ncbi:YmfQ family protein [Marinomonas transparens]|uniref:DUF2313 domain-containing protein n=1 Tax=Marinomonas transparens TaxID=2795388 RepID=A0A934JRW9_9GAMM|nr:putative phage tail protein [Marinomonas transparens]MBJ7537156.1 DUF2313 domain-containing protein [Marinomonas transparens]
MVSRLTQQISEQASQYQQTLLALLPQGSAWPRNPDSELGKLMAGLAEELARIDQRALEVLNESHPSQAYETFAEWEEEYGLPDPCSGANPSFQERLAALLQTYRMQGSQNREFFIEMASIMGYEITITEYQTSMYGERFGGLYGGEDWAFTWQINAASINFKTRHYGDPWGEAYRTWSNQRLECVFNRLKQAHTHLIFSYQSEEVVNELSG